MQSTQHMSETPNVSRPFSIAVKENTSCLVRRRRHLCTPEPAEPQVFAATWLSGQNHSLPPVAAAPSSYRRNVLPPHASTALWLSITLWFAPKSACSGGECAFGAWRAPVARGAPQTWQHERFKSFGNPIHNLHCHWPARLGVAKALATCNISIPIAAKPKQ